MSKKLTKDDLQVATHNVMDILRDELGLKQSESDELYESILDVLDDYFDYPDYGNYN